MVSVSTASKFASHPKVIKNRRLGWFTRGQETISKPADYGRESFPDDSAVMFRSIHWVSASSSEAATPTPAVLAACSNRSIKVRRD